MIKVFIASSTGGLSVAYAIQENLAKDAEVVVWDQAVFEPSLYPLEALEGAGKHFDYGIFVMTPDDLRQKSGRSRAPVPRDNVVFECGLFVGSLGRRRSCLVVPSDASNLQLPTDLDGFGQARYNFQDNLTAALGPACTKIRRAIGKLESGVANTQSAKTYSPTIIACEPGSEPPDGRPGSFVHHAGRLSPSYSGQFLRGASKEICILGFSLSSFVNYFDSRPEVEIKAPIRDALSKGARVCLLCLDPESTAAQVFAKERGDKRLRGDIRRSIERALELASEFKGIIKGAKMEVRVYSRMPFAHIKRVDGGTSAGRLMCFHYLPELRRADTPYFEVRKRTNALLFQAYSTALDTILKESRPTS